MYAFSFVAGRLGDRYGESRYVPRACPLLADSLSPSPPLPLAGVGYKRMIAIGAVSCFLMMVISAFVSFSLPLLFVFQG